jgi:hypothetical protein
VPDAPAPTRSELLWWLAVGVTVGVGSAVVSGATTGVVGLVTNGVAALGGSLAVSSAGQLYRLRHPSRHPAGESTERMYALGVLAVFFAAAGSFISWAMLDPGSGCVDCDTPSAHAVATGILVVSWAVAGFLVWRLVALRRGRGSSGPGSRR